MSCQQPTGPSKQRIRTPDLGHVTGFQPIRDQYFLVQSVPAYYIIYSFSESSGREESDLEEDQAQYRVKKRKTSSERRRSHPELDKANDDSGLSTSLMPQTNQLTVYGDGLTLINSHGWLLTHKHRVFDHIKISRQLDSH